MANSDPFNVFFGDVCFCISKTVYVKNFARDSLLFLDNFPNSGTTIFLVSGPISEGFTPLTKWAATGAKTSRPWKVLDTLL